MTHFAKRMAAFSAVNLWLVAATAIIILCIAEPAMAQDINLDPIQNFLQGLVDALTGPLGMVIATLALVGVFITWFFGIIDFRQAMWVVIAIAGIGGATTMVSALWN